MNCKLVLLFLNKFVSLMKRIREIPKITLVDVVIEDMLIKKAIENMILEKNTCGISNIV